MTGLIFGSALLVQGLDWIQTRLVDWHARAIVYIVLWLLLLPVLYVWRQDLGWWWWGIAFVWALFIPPWCKDKGALAIQLVSSIIWLNGPSALIYMTGVAFGAGVALLDHASKPLSSKHRRVLLGALIGFACFWVYLDYWWLAGICAVCVAVVWEIAVVSKLGMELMWHCLQELNIDSFATES